MLILMKNFFIIIPNEAHHSDEDAEVKLVTQPFLPENLVINKGTSVTWFNADHNHEHHIEVNSAKNIDNVIFESETFDSEDASTAFTFSDEGLYSYQDPTKWEGDYVMRGTIEVISLNTEKQEQTSNNNEQSNSLGTFIVPLDEKEKFLSEFQKNDLQIKNEYIFEDLGGNDKHILLTWQSNSDYESVVSSLKSITAELPYS